MIYQKKSHHEITIELQYFPGNVLAAVPNISPNLLVGDTVSYSSTAGTFRVAFPDGSLFKSGGGPTEIIDSKAHSLLKDGLFECRCFITPPGGKEVGWSAEQPESGGVHDVKKPL